MRRRVILLLTIILVIAVVGALGAVIALRAYAGPSTLTGRAWTLTRLVSDGQEQTLLRGHAATLRFQPGDHTISGSGGCNSYGGSYTIFGSSLHFGEMRSTLIACLDTAAMNQESAYLQALGAVESYRLDGDTLTLEGSSGRTAITFHPAGATTG